MDTNPKIHIFTTMIRDKKIAIIGCGNLGQSILKGLLDDPNLPKDNVIVTKRNLHTLNEFASLGIRMSSDNALAIQESEVIIVALKPYNILNVLGGLKNIFDPKKHIVISLATGITMEEVHRTIGEDIPVFRAMPNIAADVNESLTCICSSSTNPDEMKIVRYLFDNVGDSIIIEEKLMEAATVLGACGIAYALRFIRAMIQGGIQIGFSAEVAGKIVNQTVKGAAELLIERKQHPEYEIDKVTTPKGCTIVGINEMEHNGFSSALIKGIVASFKEIE